MSKGIGQGQVHFKNDEKWCTYRQKIYIWTKLRKTKTMLFSLPCRQSAPPRKFFFLKVIGQGQGHFKSVEHGVPSKIFIYQPNYKTNKTIGTVILHDSNPHLRGNFDQVTGQGHFEKMVYHLKKYIFSTESRKANTTNTVGPTSRTFEDILLKVIGQGQGHFKNDKKRCTL